MLLSWFPIFQYFSAPPFIVSQSPSSICTHLIIVKDCVHVSPFLSNFLPMRQSRERSNDEERSFVHVWNMKIVEKSQWLDGLSKSHFICKNHVSILMPTFDEPIDSCYLIWLQYLPFLKSWESIFFSTV